MIGTAACPLVVRLMKFGPVTVKSEARPAAGERIGPEERVFLAPKAQPGLSAVAAFGYPSCPLLELEARAFMGDA